MSEHQVVVVFDVDARNLLDAGRAVAKHLQQTATRLSTLGIDSWWMPEEPLRTEVDGNDNSEMELVAVEKIDCPPCDGSGELSICANDGTHGCSHVHDETFKCPACDGTGEVRESDTRRPDWCTTCGLSLACPECAA